MKSAYKLFVLKAIVFLLLFFICDWAFGELCKWLEFRGMNNNRQAFPAEYTLYKVDADVLIIGASEAKHSYVSNIISDSIKYSVYNTGNDGQFFYYQNAMVNGLLDRYKPKLIVWSMEPSFLCNEPLAKQRISALKPFCKNNDYCSRLLDLKSKYEKIKVLSNCYIYNSLIISYLKGALSGYVEDKENGFSPLDNTNTRPKLIKPDFITSSEADPEYIFIFEKTLQRTRQEGVEVAIVFTPMYFDDYDYTTKNYYKKLYEIAKANDCQIIDDYYLLDDFMKPNLYKDNGHLNFDGAVAFSTKLATKLKKVYAF